jgi:hypothetical protein
MPQTDPIQGFTGLPVFTDPPNIPTDLKSLYDFLVERTLMTFPDKSTLEAVWPTARDGIHAWVDADKCAYVRSGGQWQAVWAARSWTSLALASGFTGSAQWKLSPDGDSVELRFDISGSVTSDVPVTSDLVPVDYRPSAAYPIVPASSYNEPVGIRGTATVYASNTGFLRATVGTGTTPMTRMRGRATWMLG